ncbi:MAG TPA: type III-B CRISPR module RAMP protein Cmr4 [Thermodesulfobacteriota bacterium]|nr:type III-B CRISPR module RAMP protein Cmr4 [Thermodesulfobacteriota bacterium]
MFKRAKVLFLYTETPLHTGSGSSLSVVDLPIQRERHTNLPMVQASGLKGSLRDYAEQNYKNDANAKTKITLVFGPEKDGSEHAGAISFTDARLLLFPVRSLKGIFAWVTCPSVLQRFVRDLTIAGVSAKVDNKDLNVPSVSDNEALVTNTSEVIVDNKVVLEEFSFIAEKRSEADGIAKWISENATPQSDEYKPWKEKILKNLVILPDNAFRDFTEFSTEVIARTKIQTETKTVAPGALWYEEHLPSDTLLYSLALASDPLGANKPNDFQTANDVLKFIADLQIDRFQLGGDETVGRGIVKLRILGG